MSPTATGYHVIPQAPVVSDTHNSGSDEGGNDLTPALPSDPRISWIHCILGCAVLLPWNGTV